jgi:uncharacterized protein
MAINVSAPGVYVEEIPTLPASVAPVATAIPAFIGHTSTNSPTLTPTRITSLPEFVSIFGGAKGEDFAVTIVDTLVNSQLVRNISATLATPSAYNLYYSLQLYFANGGGPCWIVSVGNLTTAISNVTLKAGLDAIEKIDEPTLLVFPDAASLATNLYGDVVKHALIQCNKLQDRFVISDVPGNTLGSVSSFRTEIGMSYLKYGAAYMPFLKSIFNYTIDEAATGITHTVVSGQDYSGPLDDLIDPPPPAVNAKYNPGLYRQIIAKINEFTVTLPPSAGIAGIYASVDRDRGVWKAPANVSVNAISGPTVIITSAEQETLNVDAGSGKSINAIRPFTGKGTLVWGARTFAGNDNEWRYVPVRRLFIMAEESIRKATEFVVFEPNDANTWKLVKGLINGFLSNLYRDGALAGATPDEAFFVKVGLGETMTAQDILEGKMYVQVGMAAVRPAEFIILQFMHKLQES